MARSNWYLDKGVKSILGASVGWYGIPGREGGNTHVVTRDGRLLCGHRPAARAVFQHCGALSPSLQPECSRCKHTLAAIESSRRRDKKSEIERGGITLTSRTWDTKPAQAVSCRSFAELSTLLERMFMDGHAREVRVALH